MHFYLVFSYCDNLRSGQKNFFVHFASIFSFEILTKIDALMFKRSPNHQIFFFGPNNRLSQPFMTSMKDSFLVHFSQAYNLARILRRAIGIFCFSLRAFCCMIAAILKKNLLVCPPCFPISSEFPPCACR